MTPLIPKAMDDLTTATFGWLHNLASHGIMVTDTSLAIRSWNSWLDAHSDHTATEVVGRNLLDVFPELSRRQMDRWYRMVLDGQVVVLSQALHRYLIPMAPVERDSPFEQMQQSVRIAPLVVDQQIAGTITIIDDVTERVAREDELKRQAEMQSFLARASLLLGASLDFDATINALARLAIPRLGDLVVVATLDDEQQLQPVAVAHVDPVKEQLAKQMEHWFRPEPESRDAFYSVLHSSAPVLIGEITPKMLKQVAISSEHRSILTAINPHSYMVVPMRARTQPLGILAFALTEDERHYTPADLDLARQLGDRAALAVENAQFYRAAQEALSLRDQFLSIASHELRTPLAALMGFSGLLQKQFAEGRTNEERLSRTIGTISRQVDRLNQLIGELLDVTQLQRGQFALNSQPLDLAKLVAHVVDDTILALSGTDAPPTISLSQQEDSVPIYGDRFRLEAVVQNLVNNAVKYGPSGGTVTVSVGSQAGEAILEVTDQGIGIPEEAQAHLFEPFFRAGNVGSRTGGFGLGLYIVHQIVSRHGGRITASSTIGQGSTFRVMLPLHTPDA